MKRLPLILSMTFIAITLATIAVLAQASLSSWGYFVEVNNAGAPGLHDFVVPLEVMDKAREDLADLRLYGQNGREIPYAVRVRKEIDEQREIAARLFNQVRSGANATEVSLDLSENPGEHNEVQIDTTGSNFRRRVDVEGSDTGVEWRTLKTGDVIFRFESQSKVVDSNRVNYPLSRYRYLRLRVYSDELIDKQQPDITSARVMMVAREAGMLKSWDTAVGSHQLLRNQGAPASSWTIDLGARVPCDRLALTVEDDSFSRQFQLEAVDDPQNIRLLSSGELTRRLGEKKQPLTIRFENEEYARKLRLIVDDYSNPTLSISAITAAAPARQMFFEIKEPVAQPLRLFVGNAGATAPHYDFEKELQAKLAAPPVSATAGTLLSNPDFRPEPLPFTERVPWLIYLVLTISSLALALILFSLARATMRMKSKTPDKAATEGSA